MTIRVTNVGSDADTLHVLPHLWYRNTWSWDDTAPHELVADGATVRTDHPFLGPLTLSFAGGPTPELLFCDNETNSARLFGVPGPRYPKDGINDHVVAGAATVNPAGRGSKFDGLYASVDYEPAESFPVNYLAVAALDRYYRFFGDDLQVEYPTGSGQRTTLDRVADDLRARLVSLFLAGPDGRRPVFGGVEKMQTDPRWRDQILFYEYFDGDNGAGLGASHQTGWTGLVADLIRRRHKAVPPTFEVVQRLLTAQAPLPE